ncbi:glycoside hydrolase family 43 protein [Lysobacter korlensis]|uniref:Glycoside hydrolase family 43 protein n=1 Tax=Lysobacter korlensis TaxID=553636 RepID=A0ABV6RTA3_9GAMM
MPPTGRPTAPLHSIPVHDPFLLTDRASGRYLLYTAYDGRADGRGTGIVAYTSQNLRDWAGPEVVFRVPDGAWPDPGTAPWAPEVHAYRGQYFLFLTMHDPHTALSPVRRGENEFAVSNARTGARYEPTMRGVGIAVADRPEGPFRLIRTDRPTTPPDFMALDGTLFVGDDGTPWMVYAHEWVQLLDGTMEAVRLSDDLGSAVGDPVHLFRGSEASWLRTRTPGTAALPPYVTDGPQLRRLPGGALAMLWASYRADGAAGEYVETYAVSPSGSLFGPWIQGDVLVDGNAGHGMLFETFDGTLMLVLHRGMNTPTVRPELHEVVVHAGGLRLGADRRDLYGP